MKTDSWGGAPEEISPTQPAPSSPFLAFDFEGAGLLEHDAAAWPRPPRRGVHHHSGTPRGLVLIHIPGAVDILRHERVPAVEEQAAFV